jgi:aspartate kinase
MEDVLVTGIAHDRDQAKITIKGVPDRPGLAARIFGPIARANIIVDVILQNTGEDGTTDVTFTVPRGELAAALRIVEGIRSDTGAREVLSDATIAKVSIVGLGMRSHAGVAASIFEALAHEGINIQMISTSEIKVSVVIDEKYVELAVRALHAALVERGEGARPS